METKSSPSCAALVSTCTETESTALFRASERVREGPVPREETPVKGGIRGRQGWGRREAGAGQRVPGFRKAEMNQRTLVCLWRGEESLYKMEVR
jgi:hypothetical protein